VDLEDRSGVSLGEHEGSNQSDALSAISECERDNVSQIDECNFANITGFIQVKWHCFDQFFSLLQKISSYNSSLSFKDLESRVLQ
jgi:hypothetical protein